MVIRPVGESALIVDLDSLDAVLSLRAALADPPPEVTDVVPAATTVLVAFDATATTAQAVARWISEADAAATRAKAGTARTEARRELAVAQARADGLAQAVREAAQSSATRAAGVTLTQQAEVVSSSRPNRSDAGRGRSAPSRSRPKARRAARFAPMARSSRSTATSNGTPSGPSACAVMIRAPGKLARKKLASIWRALWATWAAISPFQRSVSERAELTSKAPISCPSGPQIGASMHDRPVLRA